LPRAKRITLAGHYHLVIAKSSSDSQLFYDATDFDYYLQILRQMIRDKFLQLYAFCLQESELRLVIKPRYLNLARIMQRIHCNHTMRINRKQSRTGHLFSGRFRSIIFMPEDLKNVVRSAHLWPVRTGLTRRAESYRYSSCATYFSGLPWNDLINVNEVLLQFGTNLPLAQKAFARFVESAALENDNFGVSEISSEVSKENNTILDPYNEVNGSNDPAFLSSKKYLSLNGIAKHIGLLLNVNPTLLFGPSRRQDLVMARRLLATAAVMNAQKTITEVASFLARDKAQVSRLVSQGMDLIDNDEPFRILLESIKGHVISLPSSQSSQHFAELKKNI
jgi:putative transposase